MNIMEEISMQLIIFMFRFLFIMFCFRIITNILRAIVKTNSIKKQDNITKRNKQNGSNSDTEQGIKTEKKPVIEMVKDELCGTHVQKEKAYIVVDKNDKRHYFCSWKCRQKFIKASGNIK